MSKSEATEVATLLLENVHDSLFVHDALRALVDDVGQNAASTAAGNDQVLRAILGLSPQCGNGGSTAIDTDYRDRFQN